MARINLGPTWDQLQHSDARPKDGLGHTHPDRNLPKSLPAGVTWSFDLWTVFSFYLPHCLFGSNFLFLIVGLELLERAGGHCFLPRLLAKASIVGTSLVNLTFHFILIV